MGFSVVDLVAELKGLRKGRGIDTADIGSRVGPALRWACGVRTGDGPVQTRRKVADRLRVLVESLPSDLCLATCAAFGLDGDARMRLYQERVEHIARKLDRDPRTVQRRIDDGITRIAELALEPGVPEPVAPGRAGPPWHTAELRASVVLDLPVPEVIETRRIIAERDRLAEVELAVTLTPPPGWHGTGSLDELGLDVLYGGVLTDQVMKSSNRIGFALRLPEPLSRHDQHEYAIRIKLPPERGIAPHYVCTPRYPCALFRLHVRFGPDRAPDSIWRLQDALPLELGDPELTTELLPANCCGEVHTVFTDLEPHLSYGVAWAAAESDDRRRS